MYIIINRFILIISLFLNIISTPSFAQEINNQIANNVFGLQDIYTPFGTQLSSLYKRSFAYKAITERMPVTLARTINLLNLNREKILQHYGQSSNEDLNQAIQRITDLRNEILTNEPLKPLIRSSSKGINSSDFRTVKVWNDYLEERTLIEGGTPRWYSTIWIYNEPYMYQRVAQAFRLTETLQSFDPFFKQKKDSFDGSIASVIAVASYAMIQINRSQEISLIERKTELIKFLKLGLWGNRRDLSISNGAENNQVGNPIDLLSELDKEILVNDTDFVWNVLTEARASGREVIVDIVLDNSGYEFFTDLCLASFLISHNLADKVKFYIKETPWFISDVTFEDFQWVIQKMRNSSDPSLKSLGEIARGHLENGVWSIEEESFWTSPFLYYEMAERDPNLYEKLSGADLVVFKGDLNYRKLLGDFNWEYTTSFSQALRGFLPTNLLSLRTVKAEVCVGLKPQQGETINRTNPDWMLTGQYGLIQSASYSPRFRTVE